MKRFAVLTAALLFTGCTKTTDGSGKPDFSALRARSSAAHDAHRSVRRGEKVVKKKASKSKKQGKAKPAKRSVPMKPKGTMGVLRGEGMGSTRHEAVLQAIQSVSAQIMSKVQGTTVTRDYEDASTSEGSVERRLKTESAFPYAELIRVVDVARQGTDFVVTAELDREEAITALKKGFRAELAAFKREIPRIKTAVAKADYAILLSQRFNPSAFIRKREIVNRMLNALGSKLSAKTRLALEDLAADVSKARGKARLYLTTEGAVSKTISSASATVFADLLQRRGCQLVNQKRKAPGAVRVKLTLTTRDHEEFDAKWVYLGFKLQAISQTDGRVVVSVNGMPEFVHGGGMKRAQAEAAVIEELTARLKQKPELFDTLICGEDL